MPRTEGGRQGLRGGMPRTEGARQGLRGGMPRTEGDRHIATQLHCFPWFYLCGMCGTGIHRKETTGAVLLCRVTHCSVHALQRARAVLRSRTPLSCVSEAVPARRQAAAPHSLLDRPSALESLCFATLSLKHPPASPLPHLSILLLCHSLA